MQRLLVALLAAFDAAVAAAVGLTVLLAPLTLLWALAFGGSADWGALWPVTGTLWQFGHGVPLQVALPPELLVGLGVSTDAARFALSVTPLAFLVFTLLAAARSGARAARAGAWIGGVVSGSVVFAVIATLVSLTAAMEPLQASVPLGILLPAVVYLIGALVGAVVHAWREGDEGVVDRLHDVVDSWDDFSAVPGEIVRGTAAVLAVLVGAGGLAIALQVVLRGGEIVALFERAHVDALGATVITLGQLAYLPTVLVWAISWIAGPGFAVGAGTAVSPVGTDLGVVPGIPIFGLLPDGGSIWMLVVVLVPVAAGALAGWMVRSRLVWENTAVGWRPRAIIAVGIPMLAAGLIALAALLSSGSIGPGRLAHTGPHLGWLALAIGVEVLVGAAIMLLSPRNREELAEERSDRWAARMSLDGLRDDAAETAPIEDSAFFGVDAGGKGGVGGASAPPVD